MSHSSHPSSEVALQGVALSALVLGGSLWIADADARIPMLVSGVAMTAGWLAILARLPRRPKPEPPSSDWTRMQEMLGQSTAETLGQLAAAREEMGRVRGLQAEAVHAVWARLEEIAGEALRVQRADVCREPGKGADPDERAGPLADGMSSGAEAARDALPPAAPQGQRGAAKIAAHVSGALVQLQFQDITSQLLGHVERRLMALASLIEALATLAALAVSDRAPRHEPVPEGLEAGHGRLAGAVLRARQLGGACPVPQTDLRAGAVELF